MTAQAPCDKCGKITGGLVKDLDQYFCYACYYPDGIPDQKVVIPPKIGMSRKDQRAFDRKFKAIKSKKLW